MIFFFNNYSFVRSKIIFGNSFVFTKNVVPPPEDKWLFPYCVPYGPVSLNRSMHFWPNSVLDLMNVIVKEN